jgi:hypothetical protein
MRTHVTLLFICLFVARAAAQEITSGQASFLPGETFLMHSGPWVDPGPAVEDYVWDFSTFASSSDVPQVFVAPGSTLYGGSFPSATVAQEAGPNAWGYYRGTADAFEQLGVRSANQSVICGAGDEITVIPYPLSYGNGTNTEFVCDGVTFGETFDRVGNVSITADGYGDIVLPYGTISNVLRVYWEQNYTDVGNNVDDFGYLTNYFWYKPGVHCPVMAIYHIETFSVYLEYTWMADQFSIGIEEALRNDIGVELYPNPASQSVSVVLGSKGHVRLAMIDGTGKTVRMVDLGDRAAGIQKEEISLEGLAPGPYTVRVTDDHGGSGSQRLIVQ